MSSSERIRILFCDHLGLARGKYLPAWHAESGKARFCVGTYALTYSKDLIPATGSKMLEGLPDFEAVFDYAQARPGWEENTKVVIPDLEMDGKPLALCGRQLLKKSINDWSAKGLKVQIGIELEAYIMQKDSEGKWEPYDTPGAYVYGTGKAVDPAGLIDQIWEYAAQCNLPVESINSEFDSPQFEFTLRYADAMTAIDDIFLFKTMAKEIVASQGYLLSFMPKPLSDRGGNGFHVNISLLDDKGENVLNAGDSKQVLSEIGQQCVAGLINHHPGMSALLAPTVNSYKRLQPASLSGFWANWGYDHRGVTIRIPGERGPGLRIEHRTADCASNPYVATAAVLQAARLGVENNYELPPEETQDCFENVSTEICVPANLEAALDALEADKVLIDSLNPELIANFCDIKRKEWENYKVHTTDWELSNYLEFV
jgi:glutamine synthetase